jgi:sugar lactone lactonase YvrE
MPQMQTSRHSATNLYVANHNGSTGFLGGNVTVYAPGKTKVLRTISQGVSLPDALAFDSGYLYVANDNNTVTIYAPGKTTVRRKISQGLHGPDAFAFDGFDNLYVANGGSSSSRGNVTVYVPGSSKVLRTISQAVDAPIGLAFGP